MEDMMSDPEKMAEEAKKEKERLERLHRRIVYGRYLWGYSVAFAGAEVTAEFLAGRGDQNTQFGVAILLGIQAGTHQNQPILSKSELLDEVQRLVED